jgi:hypothetical protein
VYLTILLGSLPKSYGPLLNVIAVTASITKMKLKADNVITQVTEEDDRHTIEARQLKANENIPAVNSHRNGQHQGGKSNCSHLRNSIECWKCGKTGHVELQCPDKEKGKEKGGRDRKKGSDSANVAAEDNGSKPFAFLPPLQVLLWHERTAHLLDLKLRSTTWVHPDTCPPTNISPHPPGKSHHNLSMLLTRQFSMQLQLEI